MQQGQEDADGFLFVPGQDEGQGQVVDAAAEGFRQGRGDADGAVGVVALADIHEAREACHRAQVEVIEAVLAAGQCQDDGVGRRLFHEVRVVAAARFGAVAASDEEKVPDLPRLDGRHDVPGMVQHKMVAEACRDLRAAVDAGPCLVFRVAAQFQGLFDDRREILVRAGLAAAQGLRPLFADMDGAREGHDARREDAVAVRRQRRHEAVRREQHRRRDAGELLALVLPGRAEVALQVRVLVQFRIGVGRQHLAVGVDVDALARRLFQEHLKVVQVVARDHDEGSLFDGQGHRRRHGVAVGLRIGLVQELHTAQVDGAGLQDQGQQRVGRPFVPQGAQGVAEEVHDSVVRKTQHPGVVGIGSHAAQAEQEQALQGPDILVSLPDAPHVVVRLPFPAAGCSQAFLLPVDGVHQVLHRGGVEVDVRNGREQSLQDQPARRADSVFPAGGASLFCAGAVHQVPGAAVRGPAQGDQGARQLVLQPCHFGRLAAHPCQARAALAGHRLFTLKAKHLRVLRLFHFQVLLKYKLLSRQTGRLSLCVQHTIMKGECMLSGQQMDLYPPFFPGGTKEDWHMKTEKAGKGLPGLNGAARQAIRHCVLFEGIGDCDLTDLLGTLAEQRRVYARDEAVLHQGDRITRMGLLLSGSARIERYDYWGSRHIVNAILPGDIFGESYAAAPQSVLGVSVIANEPASVLFLNLPGLLQAGTAAGPVHATLIRNLVALLASRNVMLNEKLTYVTQHTLRDKLLAYLSAESLRRRSDVFDIPFDRQQLADFLNADRSALSNELSKLRKEGILDCRKNHFRLRTERTSHP